MKIHLNFVPKDKINAPEVTKVQFAPPAHLYVNRLINGAEEVNHYDFSHVQPGGTQQAPGRYQDTVYRWHKDNHKSMVNVWIAVVTDDLPETKYRVSGHKAKKTVWKAKGQNNAFDTVTHKPTWAPSMMTDADWKAIADAKLPLWREQIARWLMLSPQYAHYMPDITTYFGYWLKSADAALFEIRSTVVAQPNKMSWKIFGTVLDEVIKGPKSLDPEGDGAFEPLYFQRLAEIKETYPTGPDFGLIWVNVWDLTDMSIPSDVIRVKNITKDILDDKIRTYRTQPVRKYDEYNPLEVYW